MPIIVAVLAVVGVALMMFGLSRVLQGDQAIEERLEQFASREAGGGQGQETRRESPLAAGFERAVAKQSFAHATRRELARADLKLTVAEYVMLRALSTVLLAILGLAISGYSPIIGLVGGVAGFLAPRFYVQQRQAARLKAFNDQLGDTITMLANSLRSGYSLLQSMQMVSQEAPAPTSTEFSRVVREVGLGLSPEEALGNLVRRINSEDLDMMVTAINVQHEVGGNLAQILETIGDTIRQRVRLKGEISVLTAQQTVAGYIISALPFLLALALFLINREYLMGMFQGIFICMPIAGVAMIIVGFLVIRKIVDIKV